MPEESTDQGSSQDELTPHLAKTESEREALRGEKITPESIREDMIQAIKDEGGLHLEKGLSDEDNQLIETAKSLHTEPTSSPQPS